MKEKILEICNDLNRMRITVGEAQQQLLDLFAVNNSALIKGCKTVIDGYEADGMEGMRSRDEVFYIF